MSRAVLSVAVPGYLWFMFASHYEVFSIKDQAWLGLVAIPLGLSQFGWMFVTAKGSGLSRGEVKFRTVVRRGTVAFAVVFLVLAGAAFVEGGRGSSSSCPVGQAGECFKSESWKLVGGVYYRMYPYDSQGNALADPLWVPISRDTYIAESGAKMRDFADFCVSFLCFALLCSLLEEAVARTVLSEQPWLAVDRQGLDPDYPSQMS